jgi:hypothetical protein
MLTTYLKTPRMLARYRPGPAGPHLETFVCWLEAQGYPPRRLFHLLRGVHRFSCWAHSAGYPLQILNAHALEPMFKGSECPCRFLGLRVLPTTRRQGPVPHRAADEGVGAQRAARPRAHRSRTGPLLLVPTRPPPPPLALPGSLGGRGAAGHTGAGSDGPGAGARWSPASRAPSASRRPRSVPASPATRGRSPPDAGARASRVPPWYCGRARPGACRQQARPARPPGWPVPSTPWPLQPWPA